MTVKTSLKVALRRGVHGMAMNGKSYEVRNYFSICNQQETPVLKINSHIETRTSSSFAFKSKISRTFSLENYFLMRQDRKPGWAFSCSHSIREPNVSGAFYWLLIILYESSVFHICIFYVPSFEMLAALRLFYRPCSFYRQPLVNSPQI